MFYAEYVLRLEFKLYADFDEEGKYIKKCRPAHYINEFYRELT